MAGKVPSNELMPVLYGELRKLARARMRCMRPGHTLQPTALVHEAYIRLAKDQHSGWNGRGHFFGAAALAMRDILVEHARKKAALKRGGDMQRVDLTVTLADGNVQLPIDQILSLDRALEEMQEAHPHMAQIVLLRYFAGLKMAEIAQEMEVPLRTLEREWRFAKAWLRTRMEA